ncbi:PDZ domain-containing protein [bacterium]|nr:PDZ domain-containing protein [candidate division CSSED10-310 bacterium]
MPNLVSHANEWDDHIVSIIRNARPGIVMIEARSPITNKLGPLGEILSSQNPPNANRKWYTSVASGVAWNDSGYVVTTASVVREATDFRILNHFGETYKASLIGLDEESNLSVLRCDTSGNWNPKPIAKRQKPLLEGSWIALLGYGYGGVPTVSAGIAGMAPKEFNSQRCWFQFTAPVRPGNSGSALVDSDGNLAGIVLGREEDMGIQAVLKLLTQRANNSPASNPTTPATHFSNYGVAISIADAEKIVDQLIEKGEVVRGWLGVSVQEIACSADSSETCLQIVRVVQNSPADNAGLKQNDILIKYNGKPIHSALELGNFVEDTTPGTSINLDITRDNQIFTISTEITHRPTQKTIRQQMSPAINEKTKYPDPGINVQNLTPALRTFFKVPEHVGVLISEITPDSILLNSGLQVGDIITQIDNIPISCDEDFYRTFRSVQSEHSLLLTVYRKGNIELITVAQ